MNTNVNSLLHVSPFLFFPFTFKKHCSIYIKAAFISNYIKTFSNSWSSWCFLSMTSHRGSLLVLQGTARRLSTFEVLGKKDISDSLSPPLAAWGPGCSFGLAHPVSSLPESVPSPPWWGPGAGPASPHPLTGCSPCRHREGRHTGSFCKIWPYTMVKGRDRILCCRSSSQSFLPKPNPSESA